MLLPIICSVSARAESILNEGQLHLAAVFFSNCLHVAMEIWLFLSDPARKARVSQVEGGEKAAGAWVSGWGVRGRPGGRGGGLQKKEQYRAVLSRSTRT